MKSIKEMNDRYNIDFRPVKVRKGKYAGLGPVYS